MCEAKLCKVDTKYALEGRRICHTCDNLIIRKKPPKYRVKASTARYAREVESGKRKAPYKIKTILYLATTHNQPIPLTEAGLIPKTK